DLAVPGIFLIERAPDAFETGGRPPLWLHRATRLVRPLRPSPARIHPMYTQTRPLPPGASLLLAVLLMHPGTGRAVGTESFTFPVVADTTVDNGLPTTNLDSDTRLRIDASPIRISYLRFAVSGLGARPVLGAKVRLGVSGPSTNAGTIHAISDGSWSSSTVTYATRPAIDGPGLDAPGAAPLGAVMEFNVSAAVTGDGVYNFALDSTSTDGVTYNSSAVSTGLKPELVVTVPALATPVVHILQPVDGALFFTGDTVTLQADVTDDQDVNLADSVAWTSNTQGPLGAGALVNALLAEGTHTVTASVVDSTGLSGSTQITLTVKPRPATNTVPLVALTAPADGATFAAGQTIAFAGSATDLEDGVLTGNLV